MTTGFFLRRLNGKPSEVIQEFMPHLPYPLLEKAESLRLALLEIELGFEPPPAEEQPELFTLTRQHREMLDYILAEVMESGRHPSYWKICVQLGWKSVSSVQLAIKKLVSTGHLVKTGRSYKIIKDSNNRDVKFQVERK